MQVRFDRIARAQTRMREAGLLAIVVMTHDDYRYFFGEDRSQPRAIIPVEGPPELIAFAGEEPELRAALGEAEVRIFRSVGGQIYDVVARLRELAAAGQRAPSGGRPRVGMQLWFDTPAFLVDLFRQVNPEVELVSSDPVLDPLRMIKDPEEVDRLRQAQQIAGLGMDRVRALLRPGVLARDLAREALCAMLEAGAESTATPIWITFGAETCMLHGRQSGEPLRSGELVVVDLTPQVEGYGANLARTFVLGAPGPREAELLTTYGELVAAVRGALRPGATMGALDRRAAEICTKHGLGEFAVQGIGHGIGLRFEEPPAPTIIPAHRNVPLQEGMTVTIGHPVLAIPGLGGARLEDVYRVTAAGGELLAPYPVEPIVEG